MKTGKYHVVWDQREGATVYAHSEDGLTVWRKEEKGATEFSFLQARTFILNHCNPELFGAIET